MPPHTGIEAPAEESSFKGVRGDRLLKEALSFRKFLGPLRRLVPGCHRGYVYVWWKVGKES